MTGTNVCNMMIPYHIIVHITYYLFTLESKNNILKFI